MEVGNLLTELLKAGWVGLLDYLGYMSYSVLCRFFHSGILIAHSKRNRDPLFRAENAKVDQLSGISYRWFYLAVCSCTILPLFAGIWKMRCGAWSGNHVPVCRSGGDTSSAISYTGAAIGDIGAGAPCTGNCLWHRHWTDHVCVQYSPKTNLHKPRCLSRNRECDPFSGV